MSRQNFSQQTFLHGHFLTILAAGLAVAAAHASSQIPRDESPPAGRVIDGSRTPELIPDSIACRFVLLSLALPPAPTELEVLKQAQRINRIGLDEADRQALTTLLSGFSRDYSEWKVKLGRVVPASRPPSHLTTGDAEVRRKLAAERDSIVQHYRNLVEERLSAAGRAKFSDYVRGEKRKMHAVRRPTPRLCGQVARSKRLLRRNIGRL